MSKPKAIIVMKIGPHSGMSVEKIIESKRDEEKVYGVHYWGYSGVFCQPRKTHEFCEWAKLTYGEEAKLILIETKSAYKSDIGCIKYYSSDNANYNEFPKPVQLQGAQFSFVSKDLHVVDDFYISDYMVVGGKNDGKVLNEHLRFRVNKSFAKLNEKQSKIIVEGEKKTSVLEATLVYPYAVWLKP